MQAPCTWHGTLSVALQQLSFVEVEADPGLRFRGEGKQRVWVLGTGPSNICCQAASTCYVCTRPLRKGV